MYLKLYCFTFAVCESNTKRPSTGTTVTVHELFMNFPVRQKSLNKAYELEKMRETLESIALIRPGISLSLRNDSTAHVMFQTRKCSDTMAVFAQLYGVGKAEKLSKVDGDTGLFKISGYIGREGHSRKCLQFVYVNHRLVKKSRIHKLLSQTLMNLPSLRTKGKQPANYLDQTAHNQYVFRSPPKFSEAHPVFIIQVVCPMSEYDITFEPAKTVVEFKDWEPLLTGVEKLARKYVEEQNNALVGIDVANTICKSSSDSSDKQVSEPKAPENVIAAENLTDVLLSKAAKRPKCLPQESTEEKATVSTPKYQSGIVCQAAIGLGHRLVQNETDNENHSDAKETSSIETDDTDPNTAFPKPGIQSQEAYQKQIETLTTIRDCDLRQTSLQTITERTKPEQKHISSLSRYKQSIGKFSVKGSSIGERLKTVCKVSNISEVPWIRNEVSFSSLQKFRRRLETPRQNEDVKENFLVGKNAFDGANKTANVYSDVAHTCSAVCNDDYMEQNDSVVRFDDEGQDESSIKNVNQSKEEDLSESGLIDLKESYRPTYRNDLKQSATTPLHEFGENSYSKVTPMHEKSKASAEYVAYKLDIGDDVTTKENTESYVGTGEQNMGDYIFDTMQATCDTDLCDMARVAETSSVGIHPRGQSRKRLSDNCDGVSEVKDKILRRNKYEDSRCDRNANSNGDINFPVCNIMTITDTGSSCVPDNCDISDCDIVKSAIYSPASLANNTQASEDCLYLPGATQNVEQVYVDYPVEDVVYECSDKVHEAAGGETEERIDDSNVPDYTTQSFIPQLDEKCPDVYCSKLLNDFRDTNVQGTGEVSIQRTPESLGFSPITMSFSETNTPDTCMKFNYGTEEKAAEKMDEKITEIVVSDSLERNVDAGKFDEIKDCNKDKEKTRSAAVESVTLSQLFLTQSQTTGSVEPNTNNGHDESETVEDIQIKGFRFADIFDQTPLSERYTCSLLSKETPTLDHDKADQINSSMFSEADWEKEIAKNEEKEILDNEIDALSGNVLPDENISVDTQVDHVSEKDIFSYESLAIPGTSKRSDNSESIPMDESRYEKLEDVESYEEELSAENIKWRDSGKLVVDKLRL